MVKRSAHKAALLLALSAVLWSACSAGAATEAVGVSRETAALLAQAGKSETLSPHLKQFAALRQQVFSGDFAAALAAARQGAEAAADQPVIAQEMRARDLVSALFLGYAGELTALTGDLSAAKDTLIRVERMDLPGDVKAMARAAQGYADLLTLDLSSAVSNERRASTYASGYVSPVIESAKLLFDGQADSAYRALLPLTERGSSAGQAALYAGCAALAAGRLDEASRLLDKAKPQVGYLPTWYLAAGLLAGARGDVNQAMGYFSEGGRRELGRLRRCRFLGEVAALAAGSNRRVTLSSLAASVPTNYQRLGQDLEAAPSAAAAKRALGNTALWWSLSGYQPGTLQASAPKESASADGGLPEPTVPPPGEGAVKDGADGPKITTAAGGGGALDKPAGEGSVKAGAGAGAGGGQPGSEIPEELVGVGITTYSTQAVAAFNSGMAHLVAGRNKEAWTTLLTSVKLWPGLAEGWLALGGMCAERGDARSLRDAVNAYGHAASLRPEWAEPYYGLGTVWEKLGQPQLAALHFQRALANGLSGAPATYARTRAR